MTPTPPAAPRAAKRAVSVLRLPRAVPPLLGLGAYLKSTVASAEGRRARVSAPVGDLDCVAAIERFERAVAELAPDARPGELTVLHDLHPDFYSTRFAGRLAAALGARTRAVQHHHAHTAAVMAEHGSHGPVLGLALDGFGLGPGGSSWGGELLHVTRGGFERLGHLHELPQPGGDRAAREPWRMAAAALHALGRGGEVAAFARAYDPGGVVARMLERGYGCPVTSSAGRLFDAACGLLGVAPVTRAEGEAPRRLEALVERPRVLDGAWGVEGGVLDLRPLLSELPGRRPREGAELFHGTLVRALADWVRGAAEGAGVHTVALSGGCFLNRVLRQELPLALEQAGLHVLTPRVLPPGDAALSLGQVWVGALGLLES